MGTLAGVIINKEKKRRKRMLPSNIFVFFSFVFINNNTEPITVTHCVIPIAYGTSPTKRHEEYTSSCHGTNRFSASPAVTISRSVYLPSKSAGNQKKADKEKPRIVNSK